jgi:signal transduction histidine kinase
MRLQKILLNLLSNASKLTKAGEVVLRAQAGQRTRLDRAGTLTAECPAYGK